jgi:hypothetical protein
MESLKNNKNVATMQTYKVEKIDVGSCPIDGWDDQYYRIHFKQNAKDRRK